MSKRFAARLKTMRLANKLSQRQLAVELGIDHSTISNYESATYNPTEAFIIKIAESFNVSTDYVLGLVPLEKETPKIK